MNILTTLETFLLPHNIFASAPRYRSQSLIHNPLSTFPHSHKASEHVNNCTFCAPFTLSTLVKSEGTVWFDEIPSVSSHGRYKCLPFLLSTSSVFRTGGFTDRSRCDSAVRPEKAVGYLAKIHLTFFCYRHVSTHATTLANTIILQRWQWYINNLTLEGTWSTS